MDKSIRAYGTVLILTLALLCLAEAEQRKNTKTGYISRPTNEPGVCNIRMRYADAMQLNNSTGKVRVLGRGHGTKKSHSGNWVAVIDCCEGYVRDEITGKCTVPCKDGCDGGVCSPGGICTCETGWNPVNGLCTPVCRRPCQKNSHCSSPDICTCQYGYEEKVEGQCSPICPGGCENGNCISFETCQCKPGYVMNDKRKCQAVCKDACPHGKCTAPGYCTCDEGYVNSRDEPESCLPDCGANGCTNGECTSPGVCTCLHGYKQNNLTHACVPDCSPDCGENSHCISPGRCTCLHGYKQDNLAHACIPDCSPDCGENSHCISPGRCTCLHGYKQDNLAHACVPDCSPDCGENSHCISPGRCVVDNRPIEPVPAQCDTPCINAQCTGTNTCTCHSGYIRDPKDPNNRCIPKCAEGCPNGICSSPNFCTCKPGYVKDRSVTDSQRCVPRSDYTQIY